MSITKEFLQDTLCCRGVSKFHRKHLWMLQRDYEVLQESLVGATITEELGSSA